MHFQGGADAFAALLVVIRGCATRRKLNTKGMKNTEYREKIAIVRREPTDRS
jgi:hypothetical protein